MLSNYPPGVTGNEFEISGPEREWEEYATCPTCHTEAKMLHQSHPERGVWAFCSNEDCEMFEAGFDRTDDFMVEEEPDLGTPD